MTEVTFKTRDGDKTFKVGDLCHYHVGSDTYAMVVVGFKGVGSKVEILTKNVKVVNTKVWPDQEWSVVVGVDGKPETYGEKAFNIHRTKCGNMIQPIHHQNKGSVYGAYQLRTGFYHYYDPSF